MRGQHDQEQGGGIDRRRFLHAGLVLGSAVTLQACGVLPPLPRPGHRNRSVLELPPAESGIDTVVVVMMENRSFDSYLGWLARDTQYLERGRSRYGRRFAVAGDSFQTYPAPDGTPVDTYRRVEYPDPDPWRACGHPDPGHGWNSGRAQRDGGFLAPGSGNDIFALGYFEGEDLAVYRALAHRFVVCDQWHCSLLAPTFPNREYLLSAQSGGNKTNAFPTGGGFPWDTIVDRLAAASVPVAEYYSDLPPLALWGSRMLPFLRRIDAYYDDAAAGRLPNVCFVSPAFVGGDRTDDHPHGDPRAAQRFVRDVFAAFARSPQWRRGLFVLTYDEWGGFFDHVPPPVLPDDRASAVDDENFGQAGFRVPTVLCSPRALPGAVDHTRYDHTSVLRFLEWRFLGAPPQGPGRPRDGWFLTRRDRFAANPGGLLAADRFDPDPRFDLDLALPEPSPPCDEGAVAASTTGARTVDAATGPAPFEPAPVEPSPFELLDRTGYFATVGVPGR